MPDTDPSEPAPTAEIPPDPGSRRRVWQWSLRRMLIVATMIALVLGNAVSIVRLRWTRAELDRLRREVGDLGDVAAGKIAAIRMNTDAPLVYRFRVEVPSRMTNRANWWPKVAGLNGPANSIGDGPAAERPSGDWLPGDERPSWLEGPGSKLRPPSGVPPEAAYRIAYSTLVPKGKSNPDWFGAVALPPGQSVVTITIAEDPRDERWKISTLVRNESTTQRMGTALPESHVRIFRQSHDVISTGVPRRSVEVDPKQALRLLDERWLVGEQSLLLYGQKGVDEDQIGVYVELQPTTQSLNR